jgi:hypothetical protein
VWWIWPVAVAAVLALTVWFPPTESGVLHDSYSTTAEGQRAFYRLVSEQAEWAERNTEPLSRVLPQYAVGDTLCILGPARWPTAAEWEVLLEWVKVGGQLVFACRGTEDRVIPHVDVRYIPRDAEQPPDDSLPPETDLASSQNTAWWTDGHLLAPGRDALVQYDGLTQAVAFDHGYGRIVVVATPLAFSNQLLTYGDNAVLAYRLLEAAGPVAGVTFDESLNATGTAKALGVLLDPALRPLTLQLVLLVLLYGWWNCRRYGPLERAAVSSRHDLVDHTDAVGVAYWRTKDGAPVLRAYLRALRDELRPRAAAGSTNALLDIAARRMGRTVDSVREDVQAAQRAAKTKSLDRHTTAKLIVRLATLRQALHDRARSA